MFLRRAIHEGMLPDAVVVNQSSVIREAGGLSYVYIIDDHNLAHRPIVKLGTEYPGFYVVATGLKPGDRVISSNLQKIRSGTPVQEIKKEQAGAAGEAGAASTDAGAGSDAAAAGDAAPADNA